ncbi:uncharacterized protein MONOS_869 [Monocercomonoides exilis]|uniref:uncharacterized protein n=1 Tax=Monocercomonoides exilis TaxID=2049356 RepID=UPI00355AABF6|nr:hypothetical protein MONOS_869 [Monocercomonoides exilis]|eukprot:MONOS_869.1-p1 / transcript=MONOS_869.1 / gene=MONOS_869 / organism=Monocercomonoides_exilis_PA203 / gene_product=unspecified product / transcript_product=unspecified product / location=Mono_scaffold00014:151909-152235(+) / protein_length=109 / sequence_SO=supercontig / SO=protein_coding / is_pseudo=false
MARGRSDEDRELAGCKTEKEEGRKGSMKGGSREIGSENESDCVGEGKKRGSAAHSSKSERGVEDETEIKEAEAEGEGEGKEIDLSEDMPEIVDLAEYFNGEIGETEEG